VDSLFGFSFDPSGGIRSPFDKLVTELSKTKIPILSVDVPSGWNVDSGPVESIPSLLKNIWKFSFLLLSEK
jgi:NAD(P)H-hydrate epimerase